MLTIRPLIWAKTRNTYRLSNKGQHMDRLVHGDCIEHLRALPDKAVTLILTDPPYGLNMAGGAMAAAGASSPRRTGT